MRIGCYKYKVGDRVKVVVSELAFAYVVGKGGNITDIYEDDGNLVIRFDDGDTDSVEFSDIELTDSKKDSVDIVYHNGSKYKVVSTPTGPILEFVKQPQPGEVWIDNIGACPDLWLYLKEDRFFLLNQKQSASSEPDEVDRLEFFAIDLVAAMKRVVEEEINLVIHETN